MKLWYSTRYKFIFISIWISLMSYSWNRESSIDKKFFAIIYWSFYCLRQISKACECTIFLNFHAGYKLFKLSRKEFYNSSISLFACFEIVYNNCQPAFCNLNVVNLKLASEPKLNYPFILCTCAQFLKSNILSEQK